MKFSRDQFLQSFKDPSLWVLIAGNIFSIILALQNHWSMHEILLSYWIQSVIIGAVNVYRIANLKQFSVEGLKINGKPAQENRATKISTACFFAFHYGLFHFVYLVFLLGQKEEVVIPLATGSLLLSSFGFLLSHIYSFRRNYLLDFKDAKPNIGTLMFYPYFRILPMHIVIVLGLTAGSIPVLIFMILKTIADAAMHITEHRIFRNA